MILCVISHLNTLFFALIFIFPLTKVHSLETCFHVQFFHVLKIGTLILLIVNNQAVPAKQSGPLESVNICD